MKLLRYLRFWLPLWILAALVGWFAGEFLKISHTDPNTTIIPLPFPVFQ